MVINSIEDLNLHDSELIKLEIDGEDRVILQINYIESYEAFNTSLKFLVFEECLKVIVDANFGVASPNSILLGKEIANSDLLQNEIKKWEKIHSSTKKLRHFFIETNTTNTKIDIIAEKVLFLDKMTNTSNEHIYP